MLAMLYISCLWALLPGLLATPTTTVRHGSTASEQTKQPGKPHPSTNVKLGSHTTTPMPTSNGTTVKITAVPPANSTVCYPEVGCFGNFPPFDNAGNDLPYSPQMVSVAFQLFTLRNPSTNEAEILVFDNDTLIDSSFFNTAHETKFICHGFKEDINKKWTHDMKDEFLKKRQEMNIIVVGWGKGATFPYYNQAVANTRLVGKEISLLLKEFEARGASLHNFHLIGHSLGAHIMGYAGHHLGGRVRRITGLDPAEPGYQNMPDILRLDPADAQFVDIVHTNGANLLEGGFGMSQQIGDVDFYVNGGETQRGCPEVVSGLFNNIIHGNFAGASSATTCSHTRSHIIFMESINSPCPFTAYPCKNYSQFEEGGCRDCGQSGCSVMGFHADQFPARGNMYLDTLGNSPYCGYQYIVEVKSSSKTKATKGQLSIRLNGTNGDTGWIMLTESKSQAFTPGVAYDHVATSPAAIGDISSLTIKYEKYAGLIFGWGSGEDQYTARTVTVTSGQDGLMYEFCVEGKPLRHQQEVTFDISYRRACS